MRRHPRPLWSVALLWALWALIVWVLPVSAEGGVLEGKLRNGTAGAAPPVGLTITLEKLASDGTSTVAQQAKSDGEGSFRFAAVGATAGFTYTVSAKYQDVSYRSAAFAFDQVSPTGETSGVTKPVDLTVYETTDNDGAISVDIAHAVLQPDQQNQGLWVIEVLVLKNTSDRTYVGDPQRTVGGKRPTLRFSLPAGVHSPQPMQGLDPDDLLDIVNGFADTAPVPPGERSIAYTYLVPAEGKDVTYSRAVDYPTKRFAVLMADTGGRVEAVRLAKGDPADMGGQRYQTFVAESLPAGDSVILRTTVIAPAASSADLTKIVAGIALLAVLAGAGVYIRRRRRVPAADRAPSPNLVRERLIAAIVELDEAYESGEIEEDEYRAKRAARKKRLATLMRAQAEG